MDEYTKLLVYLSGPAIVGLVTAVVALWREISELKLHISEHYVKQTTLQDIQDKVSDTRELVIAIAAKVGVPVSK